MDENGLLLALKRFAEDNSETLCEGFVHRGVGRKISQVAVSLLTPPTSYYFVLVYITGGASWGSRPGTTNRGGTHEYATYDVSITLVDAAYQVVNEPLPFEQMTLDFRVFRDRMIRLLRATRCFVSPDQIGTKYCWLPDDTDHRVDVTNNDQNFFNNANELTASILSSILRFRLESV